MESVKHWHEPHKCWTQIYNDKPISRCNPPPKKKKLQLVWFIYIINKKNAKNVWLFYTSH